MSDAITQAIRVQPGISTLYDLSHTAAWWWVNRMHIGGEQYSNRFYGSNSAIAEFRLSFAKEIHDRLIDDNLRRYIWTIESGHPLLKRLSLESGVRAADWPEGLAMQLFYRDDEGHITFINEHHEWETLYHRAIEPI